MLFNVLLFYDIVNKISLLQLLFLIIINNNPITSRNVKQKFYYLLFI